jgi:hypothetical protein
MSNPTVRGVVHVIEDTKTYGQSGFRKRLVVLEQDNGRFTNYVPVEFVQDACDSVDQMNVGDDVEVTYRLSGRKWQRDPNSEVKFFVNVEALSFNVVSGGAASTHPTPPDGVIESGTDDDDEVPF